MRDQSQKTLIGIVREYLGVWRKREGWSRETLADQLVQAHMQAGAHLSTGIEFSDHRDTFERMKNNADRVFRWLDDESKDSTLLPSNFLPSVLAAMPVDLRLRCLDEILSPLGLEVRTRDKSNSPALDVALHLVSNIKESAEAQVAVAALQDGATDAELDRALAEVTDQRNVADALLINLQAEKERRGGARG